MKHIVILFIIIILMFPIVDACTPSKPPKIIGYGRVTGEIIDRKMYFQIETVSKPEIYTPVFVYLVYADSRYSYPDQNDITEIEFVVTDKYFKFVFDEPYREYKEKTGGSILLNKKTGGAELYWFRIDDKNKIY